jgi:site-specific DNA recombinase
MVSFTQHSEKNVKRIALYLRSASARQRDPAASLAGQREALLDLVSRRNQQVVDEYGDAGISGHSLERPGLNQLLQDAQAIPRRFDIVLVQDLSRISREAASVVELSTMLEANGVALMTADQFDATFARGGPGQGPPDLALHHGRL